LDGSKGIWEERVKDPTTGKYTGRIFQDTTDHTFFVTPLIIASMVRWEYQKGATYTYESTEFVRTRDNPVELYKRTFATESAKGKIELVATFQDYDALKAEHSHTDKLSGKTTTPYDYIVVMYALHHSSGRLLRMEFKGSSRKSWFDFQPNLREGLDVKSMVQTTIQLGVSKGKMEKGDDYFFANFGNVTVNDVSKMGHVMKATKDLVAYLNVKYGSVGKGIKQSAERSVEKAKVTTALPVENTPPPVMGHLSEEASRPAVEEHQIRVEDIPF
jgi:hypothetical protein